MLKDTQAKTSDKAIEHETIKMIGNVQDVEKLPAHPASFPP